MKILLRGKASRGRGHSGLLETAECEHRAIALAPVNITSVAEGHDDNKQNIILNRIDDAVVSDTNPQAGPPLECLSSRRSWILTEQRDGTTNSVAIVMVNVLQRANRGRPQFDAIRHSQPRSALTCAHGMFEPSSAIA